MHGDWPPLEQTWPEESTVRVMDAGSVGVRDYTPRVEPKQDDGARLNSPENHRRKALEEITGAMEAAERFLEDALAWARSINYHADMIDKLTESRRAMTSARDLIDIRE